ncbi:hypothetical protein CDV36_015950 [Fusarium kuroshium]|uniref:Uncharacterized protein n=1 Tax=Fusarium kuroshium TaxID=2010991 RepID=A0A3M2R3L7_9HYPO|nr:hypothetical protein CDV36_015950 [Fusarium kuroshium]
MSAEGTSKKGQVMKEGCVLKATNALDLEHLDTSSFQSFSILVYPFTSFFILNLFQSRDASHTFHLAYFSMPQLGTVQAGAGRKRKASEGPSSPPSKKRTMRNAPKENAVTISDDGSSITIRGTTRPLTPTTTQWMVNHGYKLGRQERKSEGEPASPMKPPPTKPKASSTTAQTADESIAPDVFSLLKRIQELEAQQKKQNSSNQDLFTSQAERFNALENHVQMLNKMVVNDQAGAIEDSHAEDHE